YPRIRSSESANSPQTKIWLISWRRSENKKKARTGAAQNAISRGCRSIREALAGRTSVRLSTPSIETARGKDQDRDHAAVDDEGPRLRQVVLAGHVEHTEADRRDQRSLDRPRSAHHHDHQEVHQVLEPEGGIEAQDLDGQRPPQPGQRRPERERDAEEQPDV